MLEYFIKFTTFFVYYLLFFGLFLKIMFPKHYVSIKAIRNITFSLLLLALFHAFCFDFFGFLYLFNEGYFLVSFFLLGGIIFFVLNFSYYQNLYLRDIFKFLLFFIVLLAFPYGFLYDSDNVKIRYHIKQNVVEFVMTVNDIEFISEQPDALLKPDGYSVNDVLPLLKKIPSKEAVSDEVLFLKGDRYRFSKSIINELHVEKVTESGWDDDFELENYDEALYFALFNDVFKNDNEKQAYVDEGQVFIKSCGYVLNRVKCQFTYSYKNSSPVVVNFSGINIDLENSVLSCREIYDSSRGIKRAFFSDDNFQTIMAFKNSECHENDSKIIKDFYNKKSGFNDDSSQEKSVSFVKEKGLFFLVSKYNEALALRTDW